LKQNPDCLNEIVKKRDIAAKPNSSGISIATVGGFVFELMKTLSKLRGTAVSTAFLLPLVRGDFDKRKIVNEVQLYKEKIKCSRQLLLI